MAALRYSRFPSVAYCYRHPNRETFVSCSECGRPICAECMTPAPVGQRCPEHSGKPQGARRITSGVAARRLRGHRRAVTKTLIGVNLFIYLITAFQGNRPERPRRLAVHQVAALRPGRGERRLVAAVHAAFLHANLIHIAFNMYFLWFVGSAVEQALGRGRFLALYFVSALAGSAGALVLDAERASRSAPRARSSACSARR